jgi:peptide/nickel transport system permease protein
LTAARDDLEPAAPPAAPAAGGGAARWIGVVRRYPLAALAALVLAAIALAAVFAPFMGTTDPTALSPATRLRPPSPDHVLGTDHLGRDIWSRIVYGARVSVVVGLAVAALAVLVGLFVGLFTGFVRWLDPIVMRIMDGLMAIPGILLAIALVSVSGASLLTVVAAIVVPEVPRVVRLVRAVVLSVREEPYVEAAVSVGTPLPLILWRHVLPNCVPPLIVQATYICASAMLTEAILSFLGAGTPPTVPSWGNMVAEARLLFQIRPWNLLFPGIALAVTILAVNVLGDALRDHLDPKLAKRVGHR